MKGMKSLVAYFSRKGDNYVNGAIMNLPIGNTEVAANIIRKLTGGDAFRIQTVDDYPADYNKTTEAAVQSSPHEERAGSGDTAPEEGLCREDEADLGAA